jgi:hypothetical protein
MYSSCLSSSLLLVFQRSLFKLFGGVCRAVSFLLLLGFRGGTAVDALILLGRLASSVCAAVRLSVRALVFFCFKTVDLLLGFGDVLAVS